MTQVVALVQRVDPAAIATVAVLAGPPSPDNSRMEGTEGRQFEQFCACCAQLEGSLDNAFQYLVENVVFQAKREIQHFSERLQCQPFLADAADFGAISRPLLFWTRKSWNNQDVYLGTDIPLKWSKATHVARLQTALEPVDIHCLIAKAVSLFDNSCARRLRTACPQVNQREAG